MTFWHKWKTHSALFKYLWKWKNQFSNRCWNKRIWVNQPLGANWLSLQMLIDFGITVFPDPSDHTHTVQYSCRRNSQLRRWGQFTKFLSQTLLGPIGPNSSLRVPPTQCLQRVSSLRWWKPQSKLITTVSGLSLFSLVGNIKLTEQTVRIKRSATHLKIKQKLKHSNK